MKQKRKNVSIARTDRQHEYGHPKVNFDRIAGLWNAYLAGRKSGPLVPDDIGCMMILLKVARQMHGYKNDTITDIAGYAETLRMLRE